jgi:hypothetical protein
MPCGLKYNKLLMYHAWHLFAKLQVETLSGISVARERQTEKGFLCLDNGQVE